MRFFGPLSLSLLMACHSPDSSLIEQVLMDRSPVVAQVLANPETYRLQILYTQIDRDADNQPHFSEYAYRVDESEYFYPASTVKLPAAVLAMEKLRQLGLPGLDLHTPMFTGSAYSGQTAVLSDPSAPDSLPSVGHYVRKIFLVSDNDAFNRLYELLGQGPLNERLHELGYGGTRIVHRLEVALSPDENAHTNPIRFGTDPKPVYVQDAAYNDKVYQSALPVLLGKGVKQGEEVWEKPMDFTRKNSFPLAEQQAFLRALIFPSTQPEGKRFGLTEEDYRFLYQAMSELPRESEWPPYADTATWYDGYCKFLIYGDSHAPIPAHIRIYNKIGAAYGFLIDNAYIVDLENGVEFFLSAVIHVNRNGIFNDDTYEYDEVGFPFLAELGRAFYEYELGRKREQRPDLSGWRGER